MTRILLVGKNGQVGWELFKALEHVAAVVALGRSDLDVTSRHEVFRVLEMVKPDVVINATGYNDVDGAEINKEDAVSVNVTANALLAAAAFQVDAFYLTYSTDYVFDGQKKGPYVESDLTNPLNIYGRTKLDGEIAVANSGVNFLIFRTSSVFSLRRPCFLSNFLRKTQQAAQIQVRSDLVSSPTSARYLAEITTQIISKGKERAFEWLSEKQGIYHLAGTGFSSRFEWAQEIRDILKLSVKIVPATHLEFPLGADRPMHSALDSSKFFDTFRLRLIPWKEMLKETLDGFS
jgi:dTDP-4-dehydrorhamnose reductase